MIRFFVHISSLPLVRPSPMFDNDERNVSRKNRLQSKNHYWSYFNFLANWKLKRFLFSLVTSEGCLQLCEQFIFVAFFRLFLFLFSHRNVYWGCNAYDVDARGAAFFCSTSYGSLKWVDLIFPSSRSTDLMLNEKSFSFQFHFIFVFCCTFRCNQIEKYLLKNSIYLLVASGGRWSGQSPHVHEFIKMLCSMFCTSIWIVDTYLHWHSYDVRVPHETQDTSRNSFLRLASI